MRRKSCHFKSLDSKGEYTNVSSHKKRLIYANTIIWIKRNATPGYRKNKKNIENIMQKLLNKSELKKKKEKY